MLVIKNGVKSFGKFFKGVSEIVDEGHLFSQVKEIARTLNIEQTFYGFDAISDTEAGRNQINLEFTRILVNWLIDQQSMMSIAETALDTAQRSDTVPTKTTSMLTKTLATLKLSIPDSSYYDRASESMEDTGIYLRNIILRAAQILNIDVSEQSLFQLAGIIQERIESIRIYTHFLVGETERVYDQFSDEDKTLHHSNLVYNKLPLKFEVETNEDSEVEG